MAKSSNTAGRSKPSKTQSKKSVQTAAKKKTTDKKSSSCCCWFLASFIVLIGIIACITYDTQVIGNGDFKKSAFGGLLKDTGALPYVEPAWFTSMSTLARGYKWSEENLPIYYTKAKESPYSNLLCDLLKIAKNTLLNAWETLKNFVVAKTPVACQFVEQYIPGFCSKIHDVSLTFWNIIQGIFNNLCEFFSTKVFVGSLSPENLRKSLNHTTIAAAKYYSWFHQKVDVYAKIQ